MSPEAEVVTGNAFVDTTNEPDETAEGMEAPTHWIIPDSNS